MYYTIVGIDKQEPGLRDGLLAAHFQYCADFPIVRCAGPFVDENSGEMYGSVMVIEADNLDAAKAWASKEPFCSGLYETWAVHPYLWISGRPDSDPLDMNAWPHVFRPVLDGTVVSGS